MNKFEGVTGGTASHSTWLSTDGNPVAGYNPLMWFMALLLSILMVGCGGGGSSSTPSSAPGSAPGSTQGSSLSTAKAITAYSLAWTTGTPGTATGTISGTAIAVTVPSGTSKTAMVATFTTTGASVKAGTPAVTQVSGTTVNSFASPVTYTVTAADASTTAYTVTVTVASATTVFPGVAGSAGANATNPTVISASPSNLATNIPTSTNGSGNVASGTLVIATFNEAMNSATITSAGTFTLKETISGTNVPGTVTMASAKIAYFAPTALALTANTSYTATVTTAATRVAGGTAMPKAVVWSFTTNASLLTGQAPVNLLTAGDFAIRANTGITYNGVAAAAAVTGDVGISPNAASFITGFSLFAVDATNDFATAAEVVSPGKIYAPGYTGGQIGSNGLTPAKMTTAQNDNVTAYNEAAGRTAGTGPFLNAGAGTLDGLTLVPGVYTWGSNLISSANAAGNVTLSGGPNDVWIFQVSGYFRPGNGSSVLLSNPAGGALPQAKNIFWVVAGSDVTLGTTAHMEGVLLSVGFITLNSNATANSRLLARTAVTLGGTVTQPAP